MNEDLIAACDRLLQTEREVLSMDLRSRNWFFSKPGHADTFTVARALKKILEPHLQRKGPRMADSSVDPVQQIDRWLRQYCEHVKAPDVAKQLDHAVVFRITRTMFEQDKKLEDLEAILRGLAKEGRKPRGVGWLITVIEGKLGRVA